MNAKEKTFLPANDLLRDSFELARLVCKSNWKPDWLVALWRGGAGIAMAMHEFLRYKGWDPKHTVVHCSSYKGIGARGELTITWMQGHPDAIQPGRRVLVIDDIFDTGRTAVAIKTRLAERQADVRIATPYWKPGANQTDHRPDYSLHATESWVVFPHELDGLCLDEIRQKDPYLAD